MLSPSRKNVLIVSVAIAAILGSCCFIYFTQVKAAKYNIGLHQRIGEALAEQAAKIVGAKGHIVTIAIDTKDWPELKTQLTAFKTALKKLGQYEIREYEMDTKDQPKYGVGSGLSSKRYVRTVKKNPNADLFVSFIGAPKLTADEVAELGPKPKLLVESRSGDNLPGLFDKNLVVGAIVSRFQFPAPGPEKPGTPQEWFVKRYQILNADNARGLPKPE
jgi:hypothetical protein